jgi:hypothetical protein
MKRGALTPEELETLLEDTFLIGDREALIGLFENGAVLATGDVQEARGEEEIARFVTALWDREHTYVADPCRVLQARDTALVVADRGINVARRGGDGAWRYAIALLSFDDLVRRGSDEPLELGEAKSKQRLSKMPQQGEER